METNKMLEEMELERQELLLKAKFALERQITTINDEVELLKIIALQLVDLNTQIRINNLQLWHNQQLKVTQVVVKNYCNMGEYVLGCLSGIFLSIIVFGILYEKWRKDFKK